MKTTFVPTFVFIFYIYSSNHSLPHFWFYLRYTNKSTFGLYILSCNPFYILYLLLITIRQPAFGLTLDINKEKYAKLSVVLFPVVLRVVNFLLSLFFFQLFPCCVENLQSRFSPPIMQGATACNSVELVILLLVFLLSVFNFWGML